MERVNVQRQRGFRWSTAHLDGLAFGYRTPIELFLCPVLPVLGRSAWKL